MADTTTPLIFSGKPFYNSDAIAGETLAPDDMFDCYLEAAPGIGFATRRRPGLSEFADIGGSTSGDGIFWWDAKQWCIVVNNGQVYRLLENGTFTNITTATLTAGVPVIFADGQDTADTPWLYMANGNLVYSVDGANTLAPTDPNTPHATHVAFTKSVFIANESGTNRFDFTDTNPSTGLMDNTYWSSPDNPLTCEAKGDKLTAMLVAWQEIYAWGSQGLEIWQNDGVTPFIPIPGAFSEGGIEAPYSIVVADNTVFALCVINGARVVVKLSGRAPVVVSDPIAKILASMTTASDAIGDLISVGGLAIYLLSFPSAGQTWAYDYKNDTWTRWGYFIDGEHERFIGQHSCFCKAWNKHLILSRSDGKVYELRRDVFNDAGNEMVSYRRTPWINHGTFNRKKCDQFYVKLKTGETDNAVMLLRWRSDGRLEWGNYMELAMSPMGNRDFISKNNRFGIYRSRQYEFRLSDNADMALISVDIEVRGLSS